MSKDENGANMKAAEVAYDIPLKDILFDHDWNARNKAWMAVTVGPDEDCEADEGRGISGLVDSLRARGQDTPVWICAVKDSAWLKGRGIRQAYFGVAGFRRSEGIRRIAEADGDKAPVVKAVIRTYRTEAEAREANLRENVERSNLSSSDLAWGVYDLTGKQGITQQAAAQVLGKTQGYISKLNAIMTKVVGTVESTLTEQTADGKTKTTKKRVPIVEAWRNSVNPIPYEDMFKLAHCPIERQEEEYTKLSTTTRAIQGANAWVAAAERNAMRMGLILGLLHHGEHIDADGIRFDKCFALLGIKLKKDAKPTQVAKVIEAAKKGYAEGKKGPPPEVVKPTKEEQAAADAN